MKDFNYHFTSIKKDHCEICQDDVLHDTGFELISDKEVKQCLRCGKITIAK
jgi:hypothetical protein